MLTGTCFLFPESIQSLWKIQVTRNFEERERAILSSIPCRNSVAILAFLPTSKSRQSFSLLPHTLLLTTGDPPIPHRAFHLSLENTP
jgi:hypothetical protein